MSPLQERITCQHSEWNGTSQKSFGHLQEQKCIRVYPNRAGRNGITCMKGEIGGDFERMGKSSFKESLKALEADIHLANTMALDYPRDRDGARLQMRLSYCAASQFWLWLVQWSDCHLAGALGFLRILIYLTYPDGKTTMSVREWKASIAQFYGVIYPSLLQLRSGLTDVGCRKHEEVLGTKYSRNGSPSSVDLEWDMECGICLVMNRKIVLPGCCHSMCLKCYMDWRTRSQSCPFCRDDLTKVNARDLWFYIDEPDILDLSAVLKENCKRLFMYIEKLPLVVPDYRSTPYVFPR